MLIKSEESKIINDGLHKMGEHLEKVRDTIHERKFAQELFFVGIVIGLIANLLSGIILDLVEDFSLYINEPSIYYLFTILITVLFVWALLELGKRYRKTITDPLKDVRSAEKRLSTLIKKYNSPKKES